MTNKNVKHQIIPKLNSSQTQVYSHIFYEAIKKMQIRAWTIIYWKLYSRKAGNRHAQQEKKTHTNCKWMHFIHVEPFHLNYFWDACVNVLLRSHMFVLYQFFFTIFAPLCFRFCHSLHLQQTHCASTKKKV